MDQQAIDVDANNLQDENLKRIYQFLVRRNLQNTAETLILEATGKEPKSIHDGSCAKNFSSLRDELLASFENGDTKNFFCIWQNITPEDIKRTKEYKLLTLNLYVHFAVLPIRKELVYKHEDKDGEIVNGSETAFKDIEVFLSERFFDKSMYITLKQNSLHSSSLPNDIAEKSRNEGMEELREFLDKFGKELECEALIRPYFALPFIVDPQADPSLSQIFERKWSEDLIEELHVFLNKYKENFIVNPDEEFGKISQNRDEPNPLNKEAVSHNLPIVPNERNIPIFQGNIEMDEHVTEPQNSNRDSKNIQVNTSPTLSSANSLESVHSTNKIPNQKSFVEYSQNLALTKSHLCTIHSKYEKLKLSFYKLHGDYHKLLNVAGELTVALENSVKGEKIDLQSTLETCINIFPDLFNQNAKDDNQLHQMFSESNAPVSPKLLDFRKIKLHMINGTIKIRLFLLQALRRKITLSPMDERDVAIHEYITKDLLGLRVQYPGDNSRSILPCLLAPGNLIMPHPLQQSAARLINALSSFRCGRDYLSSGSTVVDVILQCLSTAALNETDAITCNMLIATLQKLSLRKQLRMCMIENGMVEWLIHHLHEDCHDMDPYRLENATALLMNLSLHRVAQKRASVMANLTISTLLTLLAMDHASALPYINGSLNNFLSNRIINDEAKKMKLSAILEHYRSHKTGETRRHLDHILRKHRGEITISAQDEDDADDDNEEFDVIEDELEYNDPVKQYPGELSGEALLATCYALNPSHIHHRSEKENFTTTKYFNINPFVYSIEHTSQHQNREEVVYNRSTILSESSKMTVASSANFTAACESGPTDIGKLSSIASLNLDCPDNDYVDGTALGEPVELSAEEAFLAKPKLSRTPP